MVGVELVEEHHSGLEVAAAQHVADVQDTLEVVGVELRVDEVVAELSQDMHHVLVAKVEEACGIL